MYCTGDFSFLLVNLKDLTLEKEGLCQSYFKILKNTE